jgi:hypothetical protein
MDSCHGSWGMIVFLRAPLGTPRRTPKLFIPLPSNAYRWPWWRTRSCTKITSPPGEEKLDEVTRMFYLYMGRGGNVEYFFLASIPPKVFRK